MKSDNFTTKSDSSLKNVIITLTGLILLGVLISIIMIAVLGPDEGPNDGYHLGDTFRYDAIDIKVNAVTEKKTTTDNSERWLLTITFNLKNNATEVFKFSYDSIYIKTEDRGEKYDHALLTLGDVLAHEYIMAGGSKTFTINFYVPYSITEKNYVMYFDFKFFHKISQCKLYERANDASK